MSKKTVLFEKKGRVAVITINRPEALNAVNVQVWTELGDALEAFSSDEQLWCAVLTGAGGKAFCVGSDLKEKATSNGWGIMPEETESWGYAGIARHKISKPIIAAVNGYALGGGMEIALACDLIVASDQAVFGLPEVNKGLIAGGGGLLRLPRQIPLKIAMEYALTGDQIPVKEAHKWGVVNRVVPQEQLMDTAITLAEKISENAPLAVRASKEIIYRGLDLSLEEPSEAWAVNQEFLEEVIGNEDCMEGIKAFIEKRKPVWKAK